MQLSVNVVRLVLSTAVVGSVALFSAAVPASAQSSKCASIYNSCMKSANNEYNQCVYNVENSC
ncbi:MAG: hypothetical protein WCA44_16375, partial [Acidobacteriaceae bacterium]